MFCQENECQRTKEIERRYLSPQGCRLCNMQFMHPFSYLNHKKTFGHRDRIQWMMDLHDNSIGTQTESIQKNSTGTQTEPIRIEFLAPFDKAVRSIDIDRNVDSVMVSFFEDTMVLKIHAGDLPPPPAFPPPAPPINEVECSENVMNEGEYFEIPSDETMEDLIMPQPVEPRGILQYGDNSDYYNDYIVPTPAYYNCPMPAENAGYINQQHDPIYYDLQQSPAVENPQYFNAQLPVRSQVNPTENDQRSLFGLMSPHDALDSIILQNPLAHDYVNSFQHDFANGDLTWEDIVEAINAEIDIE